MGAIFSSDKDDNKYNEQYKQPVYKLNEDINRPINFYVNPRLAMFANPKRKEKSINEKKYLKYKQKYQDLKNKL